MAKETTRSARRNKTNIIRKQITVNKKKIFRRYDLSRTTKYMVEGKKNTHKNGASMAQIYLL